MPHIERATRPMGRDHLLNEEQAGEYLGGAQSPVSPRTMQRWRLEGTGPAFVAVGRLIRYRPADLDAWLDGRLRRSTSEAKAVA
jgi:hypothetical protein